MKRMSKIIELPEKMITLGIKSLDKDNFIPISNRPQWVKPNGGLWSSPYTPDNEHVSAWHEWCSGNEFYSGLSNDSVIFTVKDDAIWYVIDDQQDLIDLIEIVGEAPSLIKFQKLLDFESASKAFDVLYLTESGAWKTHMPMGNNHAFNLYGWDCSSVLILNYDAIESWEYRKLDIVTPEIQEAHEEQKRSMYRWQMQYKIEELAKVVNGRRV